MDWIRAIRGRIPPLTNGLGDRWPLLLWRIIPPDQITDDVARMLLERGLVPSIPLDTAAIPAAQALQDAGAPVVISSGSGILPMPSVRQARAPLPGSMTTPPRAIIRLRLS